MQLRGGMNERTSSRPLEEGLKTAKLPLVEVIPDLGAMMTATLDTRPESPLSHQLVGED